jgi:hypothetical protein
MPQTRAARQAADRALQMRQLLDTYRESAQARNEAAGGLIYLDCVDVASGRRVYIRAVRSKHFRRMREAVQQRFGYSSVSLRYRGRTLEDDETPADLGMPDAPACDHAVAVEVVQRTS